MKKLEINGVIVNDNDKSVYEWFEQSATCPKDVKEFLVTLDGSEPIQVAINSQGGSVFAGSEIYTLLKSYQGGVEVVVTGLAASIASVIMMAGDKIKIELVSKGYQHEFWRSVEAGAKKAYLIEEARAAALGSGMDIAAPEGNMIIDIGGGSTDVAIISLGGTVVSKTIRVAGNNFDNDIIKYVKKTYNLLIGDRTAEDIKMKIGTALPLEEEETMEVKGRDLLMGLPKVVTITSEEVREAIKDSLDQILQCIRTVLEKTPPELASDIVDKGMIMTGGGSLIRNFPEMLTKYTNLKVTLADNPLESVVMGAGLALDQIEFLRKIEKAER